MALIRCSECDAYISDKASICLKCGCPIEITKNILSDKKKRKTLKTVTFTTFIAIITIIIVTVISVFFYNINPTNQSVKLIKKDFGRDIKIESIYYSEEQNGCIVKFIVDGVNDIATVDLDKKTAGYQSVMNEYTKASDRAITDVEKQKCAQQVVDYMEYYDILWEYNLFIKGSEESGWIKIK